jgi:hypothetical protein
LLKGIHMLSVAHVAPGAEIVVTDVWTTPLSFIDGTPRLRIPTTVGDIYGRTPLSPSEELVTGAHRHAASIAIRCENGTASLLRAGPAVDGRHQVTLDAPIDIVLSGWTSRNLEGLAADGRRVTLAIEPAPVVDASLDIDVLFDHSGSMGERAVGEHETRASKFEVAKHGLVAAIDKRLKAADRLRLWQFNDTVQFVGEADGAQCQALIKTLAGPDGGTEVGRAFDAVIQSGKAKNVVIVTDGKSYALDPHALAQSGIRLTAVLIGDDALDAGVAHLAGMTGGQAFIAEGSDADAAIGAALDAARSPCVAPEPVDGTLSHIVAVRRGARIVASWGDKSAAETTPEARQVAATAAMLAIPRMREDAAAALAESEGIVCHLTSLVLIDEAGVQHAGLPGSRKIPLTVPRAAAFASYAPAGAVLACAPPPRACIAEYDDLPRSRASGLFAKLSSVGLGRRAEAEENSPHRPTGSLRGLARKIGWDDNPEALRQGDLSGLAPDVILAIRRAAELPEVVHLAQMLGVDPVIVVIALLAREHGG